MNPNFRSRGGSSNFKGFTHDRKRKVPSSRIYNDINYYDTTDYNPLFLAVHNGKLELTHSILKKVSVHQKIFGRQVIHIAAARGHEQIICLLCQRGAKISARDVDGNTPLHLAVKGNHIDVVNLLLADFTVNLKNWKGAAPLHIATQMNNFHFVKLLLENGAKVNLEDTEGKIPLHISAGNKNPNLKIVLILLTHGASVRASCKKGFTALHYVTNSGNVKITETLIDRGASLSIKNENQMDPLCLAIQKNKTEMVKYILGKNIDFGFIGMGNMTPLHFAAQTSNDEIVKMLVMEGNADHINDCEDKNMMTPLHLSAEAGHINVVKYLIDSGALIDVEDQDLNTPLHLSAAAGHLEVVRELLNRGAKIDSLNSESFTPLCLAVKARHKEVVRLLVNKGASLEYQIAPSCLNDALPAFHMAAKVGDLEILKIFLKSGIKVDMKSKNEKTALHISATFGHTKLVTELVKAGANIDSLTKFLETPLHLAAASGSVQTVANLLKLGASVKVTTSRGYTPLHYALDRERHESIRNRRNTSTIVFPRCSTTMGVITPFYFEQYLKITEMLLIKDFLEPYSAMVDRPLFSNAFKIKVFKENQLDNASNSLEEVKASERKRNLEQGEFRPEIVRCLLNYQTRCLDSFTEHSIPLYQAIHTECPAVVDTVLEYDTEKSFDSKCSLRTALEQDNYDVILAIAENNSHIDSVENILSFFTYSERIGPLYKNKVEKLLIAILVKKRSTSKADFVVESKELESLKKEKLLSWYTQCEQEIINMRGMKVHHQCDLTFYEILTKPVSKLANYVKNSYLMRILDSGTCKKFEAYVPLLKRNIKKAGERRALIDLSAECLFNLTEHSCKLQLPLLVIEKVFEYLSVVDLRRLSATIKKNSHHKKPMYGHRFRNDSRK